MAGARYEVRGSIAIISMDNPPVNGLGYDNRLGIVNGLNKANTDDAVKAIVLTGLGKAFSAVPTSVNSVQPKRAWSRACTL